MEDLLELKNVSKKYEQSRFALKDVSFSLPSGSIMGFVGENGSGKTTVIKTILNTVKRDSGTIKIFGREMADKDTYIRQNIGAAFDRMHFPENYTATTVSRIMKQLYKNWSPSQFLGLLERLDLPLDRQFKTFSSGMSMKLSVACALSHQPKLLILDEVTNGLDPAARDEMADIFLEFLKDDSHSILFSTHITDDLEKIADYITFIHQGKILLTAKKDELLYQYGILRCRREQFQRLDRSDYYAYRSREFQTDVLVTDKKQCMAKYPDIVMDYAFIDEIMLILIKGGF